MLGLILVTTTHDMMVERVMLMRRAKTMRLDEHDDGLFLVALCVGMWALANLAEKILPGSPAGNELVRWILSKDLH